MIKAAGMKQGKELRGGGKAWPGSVKKALKMAETAGLTPGILLKGIQDINGKVYFYGDGSNVVAGKSSWWIECRGEPIGLSRYQQLKRHKTSHPTLGKSRYINSCEAVSLHLLKQQWIHVS